jgi:hypothetical protein
MGEQCELRDVHGMEEDCDRQDCVFWRVAGHLDLVETPDGCAIQYFELLGDGGGEIATWLLTVKHRIEAELQDDEVAGSA